MTMTEECWKPEQDGLQQIIQLLSESHSFDNEIQRSVHKVFVGIQVHHICGLFAI
jgi:hypothetical protein